MLTARGAAQAPRLAFAGGMALTEHRVDAGAGVEVSTGTVFDGGVRLGFGSRTEIGAVGRTGVLHPGRGATLGRDVAEFGIDGAYRMLDWLDVVGGVRLRAYTTAVARQRWTAPYLGAAARVPFAARGLRGVLSVAVHPFAAVSGLSRPEVALSGGAGMEYRRGGLEVQLLYALERYEFARGAPDRRREQLATLALRFSATAVGPAPRATPNPAVPPE
jgi:hypothetical protein